MTWWFKDTVKLVLAVVLLLFTLEAAVEMFTKTTEAAPAKKAKPTRIEKRRAKVVYFASLPASCQEQSL